MIINIYETLRQQMQMHCNPLISHFGCYCRIQLVPESIKVSKGWASRESRTWNKSTYASEGDVKLLIFDSEGERAMSV